MTYPTTTNSAEAGGRSSSPVSFRAEPSAFRPASALLTIPEAASLARVSVRTISRMVGQRPAWALRFGRNWRIDRERFLAAGQRAARQAI